MAKAKNLVSGELTDENIGKVNTHLSDIETLMPFLIALPADEKRKMNPMGKQSIEFVNTALTGAKRFSQYLLPTFKKDEFAKDVKLIHDLRDIRAGVVSLLEKIDDTIYGTAVDAMQSANEVYSYLKTASEKDAALKEFVGEMSKRYDRPNKKSKDNPKQPAEPNKPADPKQPADPKEPAEPKQPDTPKKPKDNEPDIHLPEG